MEFSTSVPDSEMHDGGVTKLGSVQSLPWVSPEELSFIWLRTRRYAANPTRETATVLRARIRNNQIIRTMP